MFTRAWQSWHRSKTIAVLAAAALAVGIGSATSIYTVVKVVLFAVSTAIVASALSSLAPLWQAVQIAPADVLAEGSRASRSWKSGRISHALVVGEVALAFACLPRAHSSSSICNRCSASLRGSIRIASSRSSSVCPATSHAPTARASRYSAGCSIR